MIKTTNIRTLKDRLRAFLRDVQRGDVVLVTDRGRVVAEIRQPTVGGAGEGIIDHQARALVASGVLTVGVPNSADAYRPADVRLSAEVIAEALDAARDDH